MHIIVMIANYSINTILLSTVIFVLCSSIGNAANNRNITGTHECISTTGNATRNLSYFSIVTGQRSEYSNPAQLGLPSPTTPSAFASKSINLATGNKVQKEIDYIGGVNTYLKLQRIYNSSSFADNATGALWQDNHHRRLASDGYYVYTTREDGRIDSFSPYSGGWKAWPNVTSQLTGTSTGWELVTENDTKEFYDACGKLVSITTRAGAKTTYTYDGNSRLTQVAGPFGHTLTFSYDSAGYVSTVTLPDGNQITYAYDTNYNLISVSYPDKSSRTYLYENTKFPYALTGIIDENGDRFVTISYDDNGLATSTSLAEDVSKTSISYNSDNTSTTVDAQGNSSTYTFFTSSVSENINMLTNISNAETSAGASSYEYDENGFLSSRTDSNSIVTSIIRDARGLDLIKTEAKDTGSPRTIITTWHQTFRLPLSITEQDRITYFTYDENGNLVFKTIVATQGSPSRTWTYEYNNLGHVTMAKDPNQNITRYTYDQTGGVSKITNSLGQDTYLTYDANNRPVTIKDPNNLVTALTYDLRGRLRSKIIGTEETSYTFDAAGNLTKVIKPDNSYTAYAYDKSHRLTKITDTMGNNIVYTLDLMNNLTEEQTFENSGRLVKTRSHSYDQLNRLVQDRGSLGQTTFYNLDNNGNVFSIIDPLGNAWTKAYDALNRQILSIDPTGGTINAGYNANDQLVFVIDPRGLVTSYDYNGLGNITTLHSPDTGYTNKTYDAVGNLLNFTDARGMTGTFTYDPLNRMLNSNYSDGNSVTFQYDQGSYGKGHLTTMVDPSGTTSWTYDQHGRVLQKTQQIGSVNLVTTYQYDYWSGRLVALTYPSGKKVTYTYNQLSQKLSAVSVDNEIIVHSIAYQPFGQASSWTQGNGYIYSRTFDHDGRITAINMPGDNLSYTYDLSGRITGVTDNFSAPLLPNTRLTNFTIAPNNNQILSQTGVKSKAYSYDAAGNLASIGQSQVLTHDARGRLVQVQNGSQTTNYLINGQGQRVAKTGSGISSEATLFFYDESGHLLGEYDASGNVIQETVWLEDLPISVLQPGDVVYYVNPDHLGAPRNITDKSNAVVWRWLHEPFGNGDPNQTLKDGSNFVYNLRLPGQYYDKETGFNYNYYRDYIPALGRYAQPDSIGIKGGINLYSYTKNNPINKKDTFGLQDMFGVYPGYGFYSNKSQNAAFSQAWNDKKSTILGTAFVPSAIAYGATSFSFIPEAASAIVASDLTKKAVQLATFHYLVNFEAIQDFAFSALPTGTPPAASGSGLLGFAVGNYGPEVYDAFVDSFTTPTSDDSSWEYSDDSSWESSE